MNKREKAVALALKGRDRAIARWSAKLEAARKALGEKCSHPDPQPMEWEHDDGYGRQSRMAGLMCDICGARCHWPNTDGTPTPAIRWVKRGDERS